MLLPSSTPQTAYGKPISYPVDDNGMEVQISSLESVPDNIYVPQDDNDSGNDTDTTVKMTHTDSDEEEIQTLSSACRYF